MSQQFKIPIETDVRHDQKVGRAVFWSIIAAFLASYGAIVGAQVFQEPALLTLGEGVFDALILDKRVLAGELWRLVTHMYLHANVLHIFFNLLIFSQFQGALETRFPKLGWLAIFFISGIAGAIAHLAFVGDVPAVGASGGVLGLWGAAMGLAFRTMKLPEDERPWNSKFILRQLLFMLGLNVVLWSMMPNIGHFAHGGGFLAGLIASFLMPYRQTPRVLASRPDAVVVSDQFVGSLGGENLVVGVTVEPSSSFDPVTDYIVIEHTNRDMYNRASSKYELLLGWKPASVDLEGSYEVASRKRLNGNPV